MDWNECLKNNIVKSVNLDANKINSIRMIAKEKIRSADFLPEDHIISKTTLLYDALRELLEAKSLERGYKVYNHECYTSFLKEILGKSSEADLFDEMRKIRNGINYYGKTISKEEFVYINNILRKLINLFLN